MHSIMWQLLFKLITCLQHWKINLINVIQHKLSKWPVSSFTETFFIDNLRWRILKYFETKLYLIFIVQNDKTDIWILLRKKKCFALQWMTNLSILLQLGLYLTDGLAVAFRTSPPVIIISQENISLTQKLSGWSKYIN